MNYSNQYHDSISTVPLSPFGEDHWNRIATYSQMYLHWTDLVMITPKLKKNKSKPAKRNLINSIDVESLKLDDEILLNEIYDMRKTAARSTSKQKKHLYDDSKFLDEDHDRRTTSPTDEYRKSPEYIRQTRESPKHHPSYVNSSFSNQQYNKKRSLLPPQVYMNVKKNYLNKIFSLQTKSTGLSKTLTNIDFGPKPQASLGIQLRQSTIARENALATSIDHQVLSPLGISSPRRALGSGHSSRRTNQEHRVSFSQSPQKNETNIMGGLYEQLSDSSFSLKKTYPRSTNTSRSTIHMLKTKNERERQKQNIVLKTTIVNPSRQPILVDNELEEAIPNSIEIMRKIGGPVTAFESNLRYNYHRQLNQFRNGSIKS
jgi:hypothetical protein